MKYTTTLDLTHTFIKKLKVGDTVLLNGTIYTSRDAAHKRIVECIENSQALPFPIKNSTIYYAGPTPTPPNKVVGSIGPTTSGRVDAYTPLLIQHGLLGMIGKGKRSSEVRNAIQKYGAVYFGFIGGAAALAAECIQSCEVIAWEELGSEAVRKLTIKDFPVTVLNDSYGNDLYELGQEKYLKSV